MAILLINSHVAHGRVGASLQSFVLQRLGHAVWPVFTTLLSNHPGLGAPRGSVVDPKTVREQIAGLASLGVLANCEAVLSGYLGDAGTAAVIADAVDMAKRANPACLYLCDPVIGDRETGQYVSDAVRDAVADVLVPRADVVTPNRFELEMLSGLPDLDGTELFCAAARTLEAPVAFATGLRTQDGLATLGVAPGGAFLFETPALALRHRPDGAGDLFMARLLSGFLEHGDWRLAGEVAVAATFGVLEKAVAAGARILPTIEEQSAFIHPERRFGAMPI